MGKKLKIILLAIIILVIASGIYLSIYYHAEKVATDCLNGSENVSVVKISNGLLLDGKGNVTAMIFYPGAKVEYTSYLPMLMQLANRGIDCYVVEMPFNFAFFGIDSADSIISNSSYEHYYISGHSLGGVMASQYVNKSDDIDGLILLAAYPSKDVNVPTLSVYGSNDGVLNHESYDESKSLIKGNFTEFVIDGGNHAQFGNYGIQTDDGQANITPQDQQNQCVNEILSFIKSTA